MKLLRRCPGRFVLSIVGANFLGTIACAITAALFIRHWHNTGTLGADSPWVDGVNAAYSFIPIGLAISVVVATPVVACVQRFSISLVLFGVALGSALGVTALIGGNYYWGPIMLAYGGVTAVTFGLAMLGASNMKANNALH